MAEAEPESTDAGSTERCRALTTDGERCSRPAGEEGFCFQHDERDPTVSESQTAEEQAQEHEQEIAPEDATDPEDVDASDIDLEDLAVDESKIEGVLTVRQTVQSTAGALIGRPFDGVSEITPIDDGWQATVEVLERRAVPDTQDILGRYEIELDEDGVVQGYRRIDRYRRGDTAAFE